MKLEHSFRFLFSSEMIPFRAVHPFPARMAPDVAWEELPTHTSPLRVLDPMAGSGTTLVAARLRGHQAIGFDRDPLAVLISSAWLTDIGSLDLVGKAEQVLARATIREKSLTSKGAFPAGVDEETRHFIQYWFDMNSRRELTALSISISLVRDKKARDLLWCAFSRLIITKDAGASLAMDVSHSRPHRVFEKAPRPAFQNFISQVRYLAKASPFGVCDNGRSAASVQVADAREMPLGDEVIDVIITSPPYLNAIDYLRGHKLSLVWMGYTVSELRALRATNVGTEVGANSSDADPQTEEHILNMCSGEPLERRQQSMLRRYVRDLRCLMSECHRVLVHRGKCVFVVGDCNVKKSFIANSSAIKMIGREVGFRVEGSRCRPLPENRRYLPPPDVHSSGAALQRRMREEVIVTLVKD